MLDPLIQQGLELMLFGMGTVVVFLALLVVATTTMSAMVRRWSKAAPEPSAKAPASGDTDAQRLAVISAAIHRYRSRRR